MYLATAGEMGSTVGSGTAPPQGRTGGKGPCRCSSRMPVCAVCLNTHSPAFSHSRPETLGPILSPLWDPWWGETISICSLVVFRSILKRGPSWSHGEGTAQDPLAPWPTSD